MKTGYRVILLTALMLGLAAPALWAQAIYRSVDQYGRVTFSDQPPVADAAVRSGLKDKLSASDANAALPYALRAVAGRYPVTLYTGPGCGPCQSARALLLGRGVPFAEMTISTQQDMEAMQHIDGDTSLPLLTIGGQHLRGFSESEWNQYLDAADYPASSQLPASYHNAPAAPLAPPPAAPAAVGTHLTTPPAAPPARTPDNPQGVRF
ncbi:MAG: glutaredoxin family protein [Betaproteobacteria bacterium]